jgi:hypothetical protein
MTDESQHDPELPEERQVAEWLHAASPVPAAGFRGALGRYLRRRDPGFGPRPPQLRLVSLACVSGGTVLLVVAALQATG